MAPFRAAGGLPAPGGGRGGGVAWARLGILAGVALLRVPTLTEPRWYSDEGFFTSVAWATSKGLALYARVFDNSPPGIYWIYRLLLALGAGRHHIVVELAAAAAAIAAALLTFEIGLRVTTRWPAVLAGALVGVALSLPTLDGDLLNVELAALPFFLAALLLALGRRPAAAVASGALLATALVIRPSFAIDSLALLVPLSAGPGRRLPRLALTAAGAGAVLVAVGGLLAAQGSLAAYRGVVLPADHAYLVWANGGRLVPLYLRFALLAAAAAIALSLSRSSASRLLAVWVPAAIAGASLTPRELTHYVHEAIPPLALLAAVLAARWPRRWPGIPLAAAGLLAAAEAVLILPAQETALLSAGRAPRPMLHNFAFSQLPAYYQNWISYRTGREGWAAYRSHFPGPGGQSRATVATLRELSQGRSGAALLVLGDEPWLYFESGLQPATRYIGLNSAFWTLSNGAARVRADLARGCAPLVVLAPNGGGWINELRADNYLRLSGGPWPVFAPRRRTGACLAGP